LGWTGKAIAVEECLRRLRAIDRAGKFIYSPGHYARLDHAPMANETYQRQCAVDQSSIGADWVLQLDTDEVVADSELLRSCIVEAGKGGFDKLNFPARWIYCAGRNGWYLEWCSRFWRMLPGYAGPIAVRAHAKLEHARRAPGRLYHVDVVRKTTNPAVPAGQEVHRVIEPQKCIYHFTWVRDEQWLRNKFASFGHALDKDWHPEVKKWLWSVRHPYLAAIMSQLERGSQKRHLRLLRVGEAILGRPDAIKVRGA
jgi:hypothetical protein